MTTHSKGHTLQQYRERVLPHFLSQLFYGVVNFQNIIAIDGNAFHTIANRSFGQVFAFKLFVGWGR